MRIALTSVAVFILFYFFVLPFHHQFYLSKSMVVVYFLLLCVLIEFFFQISRKEKPKLLKCLSFLLVSMIASSTLLSVMIYKDWKSDIYKNIRADTFFEYSKEIVTNKIVNAITMVGPEKEKPPENITSAIDFRVLYSEYLLTGFPDKRLEPYLKNAKNFGELFDALSIRLYPDPAQAAFSTFSKYYGQRVSMAVNPCGGNDPYIMTSSTLEVGAPYAKMHRLDLLHDKNLTQVSRTIESLSDVIDISSVLTRDYVPRFFGVNSDDFDMDGFGDFMVQGNIYFGSNCDTISSIGQFDSVSLDGESAFVQSKSGRFILGHDRLRWPRFLILSSIVGTGGDRRLNTVAKYSFDENLGTFSNTLGPGRLASYFSIVPLWDIDGDTFTDFAVSHSNGLEIRFSSSDFSNGMGIDFDSYIPSDVTAVYYQAGGVGDMTGDGLPEFWINFIFGNAYYSVPVSGAKLKAAFDARQDLVALGDISGPRLVFADRNADLPGATVAFLGSTMSNVSGDFDKDGRADFSYTAHYESGLAGTLYVVSGAYMAQAMESSVAELDVDQIQCGIARLRAPLATELGSKPDHVANVDFTGDGVDDIVVAADVEFVSYPMNGATYVLDGSKIGAFLKCE